MSAAIAIGARSTAVWCVESEVAGKHKREPTLGTRQATKDDKTIAIGSGRTCNGGAR
jgi:hypothetical protein